MSIFSEIGQWRYRTNPWTAPGTRMADRKARSASEENRSARSRQQELAAFAALVDEHQHVILGLCRSMGLRRSDAEDAAAEVFANVFRALPSFDGRSTIGTWIYRIAFRTILKLRAKYQNVALGEACQAQVDHRNPRPDQTLQTAELNQQVWDAVSRLEPRKALVVEMYYRRDWPLQKIADAMDCPVGTIKTLLFRARNELKQTLIREGVNGESDMG